MKVTKQIFFVFAILLALITFASCKKKSVDLELVLVEGGTFEMGGVLGSNDEEDKTLRETLLNDDLKKFYSKNDRKAVENLVEWLDGIEEEKRDLRLPKHKVTVSSFYMSNHETTIDEWNNVMKKYDGWVQKWLQKHPNWTKTVSDVRNPHGLGHGKNFPVCVRWGEAILYCNKLSKKEGLTPCYSINGITDTDEWNLEDFPVDSIECDFQADGYRLPTEAEWEFAAGGGIYPEYYYGTSNLDPIAWYKENSQEKLHDVKTKSANSIGLYDMLGNEAEWCWDYEGYYTDEPQVNPHGPKTCEEQFKVKNSGVSINDGYESPHITRGGSYYTEVSKCSVVERFTACYGEYTFRVVRSIPDESKSSN